MTRIPPRYAWWTIAGSLAVAWFAATHSKLTVALVGTVVVVVVVSLALALLFLLVLGRFDEPDLGTGDDGLEAAHDDANGAW